MERVPVVGAIRGEQRFREHRRGPAL